MVRSSVIDIIEECIKSEEFERFVLNYEHLLKIKHNENYFSYWGLNFNDGNVVSVKFYAHFLGEMSANEVSEFIPSTKDFEKYIQFKSKGTQVSMNNSGIALELKFDLIPGKTRTGFFFHIDNTHFQLPFTDKLPEYLEKKCVAKGVNYEYDDNSKLFKRYYYFNFNDVKDFFEEKLQTSLLNEANILEFSESDNISKVNIYGSGIVDIPSKVFDFSDNERSIVQYFNEKFDFVNMGYGLYLNSGIKSVYFFDSEAKINTENNSSSVKTLRKLLNE